MTPCPVETEIQEHRFRCELRAGHDGEHVWWLAAPVNTWIPMPEVWTADLLVEDDWGSDDPSTTSACGQLENGHEAADATTEPKFSTGLSTGYPQVVGTRYPQANTCTNGDEQAGPGSSSSPAPVARSSPAYDTRGARP